MITVITAALTALFLLVNLSLNDTAKLSQKGRWLLALGPVLLMLNAAISGDFGFFIILLPLSVGNLRLLVRRYGPQREKRLILRTTKLSLLLWLSGVLLTFSGYEPLVDFASQLGVALITVLAVRAFILTPFRSRIPPQPPIASGRVDYPTVSICIPARNETHALTDALRSALASDYPKLEILVLDDCSQDSTPDIIKAFAQDGVRFIRGTEPAEGWIGKNRAYEYLLSEASGDVILFAGVDIRFQPGSVRQMVNFMRRRQAKLISVLPRRRHFDFWANVFRPLRYYWQLAFVLWPFAESCWLVERKWLLNNHGFKPLKHKIFPGRALAAIARAQQHYAFYTAYGEAALTTRKRIDSLYETAIRTIYPALRREPVLAFAKVIAALSIPIMAVAVWFQPMDLSVLLLRASILLLLLSYIYSELVLQGKNGWLSGLLAPTALMGEIFVTLASMLRYEFGQVDWKGRNVCMAVMHQTARERASRNWLRVKKVPLS